MIAASRAAPVEILLVEDNEADVVLTRELLKDAKVLNRLSVARDGEEALRRACRRDEHADGPRPELILLDLNLPRKDGREVLRELKRDPDTLTIPIVVLTTSSADDDVIGAYEHHVNAYITKPVDLDEFAAAVAALERFWLGVARLPAGG